MIFIIRQAPYSYRAKCDGRGASFSVPWKANVADPVTVEPRGDGPIV